MIDWLSSGCKLVQRIAEQLIMNILFSNVFTMLERSSVKMLIEAVRHVEDIDEYGSIIIQ